MASTESMELINITPIYSTTGGQTVVLYTYIIK